jgi:uncharacterized protein (DUF1778 family)
MVNRRTALLVRCSDKEAEDIRQAAKRERRTLSGFILNAVLNRIANQKKIEAAWRKKDADGQGKAIRG